MHLPQCRTLIISPFVTFMQLREFIHELRTKHMCLRGHKFDVNSV